MTAGALVGPASRALIHEVGMAAWAVLEDVVLAARPEEGRWVARTSVRSVAADPAITPGTAVRALATLCAAGLVVRKERRQAASGRFAETLYAVTPTPALLPRLGSPYTAQGDRASGPSSMPICSSLLAFLSPAPTPELLSAASPPRLWHLAVLFRPPSSTPQRSTDSCQVGDRAPVPAPFRSGAAGC